MSGLAAMLLLAGAAAGSNWLPLNSPSPAVARGFDAASVRRAGDVVTFDAVFAARDFDDRTHRFTSERMVVPVRLDCRSWNVTIGAGHVQGGDGSMIGMDGQEQPPHEADPDEWHQACSRGGFGRGTPTVEAFLDREWPADTGHPPLPSQHARCSQAHTTGSDRLPRKPAAVRPPCDGVAGTQRG